MRRNNKSNKKNNNKRVLLITGFLVASLGLTLSVLVQRQQLQQSAQTPDTRQTVASDQTAASAQKPVAQPPLYGCIHVGETTQENCATKMGLASWLDGLKLYGRPLQEKQEVYYGDRLISSLKFTNTGDLPIDIDDMAIIATSGQTKETRDFKPSSGHADINPGQSIKVDNSSYRFDSPDPNGVWDITTKITNSDKQSFDGDAGKKTITINATCTALRVKELTEKDKANLKKLCGSTPSSKLCSSREYCEIFKGAGCSAENVSTETPGWTCSTHVYLPKPEQDILEELCKTYPDTDACKDFCKRTINSKLCPQKYLFIDTRTGKPIPHIVNDRAVYVRVADGLEFTYAKDYPKKGVKLPGIKTDTAYIHIPDPLADVPHANNVTSNNKIYTALTALFHIITVPGTEKSRLSALCLFGWCPGVQIGGGCLGTCPPAMKSMGPFSFGACNNSVPGACGPPPAAPGVPGAAPLAGPVAPPKCGVPGSPPCAPNSEKNLLPPDPRAGRIMDSNTCNEVPPGSGNFQPKNPGQPCTSLTDPNTAQLGDPGYAPQCSSGRQDINPSDDPAGVEQASCCASSVMLREGCCGQQCTVWSQKSADGKWRDGNNHVCTNDQQSAARDNTCNDYGPGNTGPIRTLPGGAPAVDPVAPIVPPAQSCDVNAPTDTCGAGNHCVSTGTGNGRSGSCQPDQVGAPIQQGGSGGGPCPGGAGAPCPDPLHPALNGTPWNNSWNSDQKEAACRDAGQRYSVSNPTQCIGSGVSNSGTTPNANPATPMDPTFYGLPANWNSLGVPDKQTQCGINGLKYDSASEAQGKNPCIPR